MKTTFGIVLICLAVCAAESKSSQLSFTGISFELTNKADPYNPAAYILSEIDFEYDCPKEGYVCGIIVPYYDVYTSGPYVGKPKVDISTFLIDELSDNIHTALQGSTDPNYFLSHDRTIFQCE